MTAMQKWIADFLFMVMDSETTFVDAGMIGVVGGVTVIWISLKLNVSDQTYNLGKGLNQCLAYLQGLLDNVVVRI